MVSNGTVIGPGSLPTAVQRTWLVRHARTGASAGHRLNGRPQTPIWLDDVGRDQCRAARRLPQVTHASVCVVSAFPRARQTAQELLDGRYVPVVVDERLNELDYGIFEGGPFWDYGVWLRRHGVHARPTGSVESQHAGLGRMAAALRQVLELPGQPLVIGHGLLLSVITHVISGGSPTDQVFPEAGYLLPVAVTAHVLTALECGLAAADRDWPEHGPAGLAGRVVTVEDTPSPGDRRPRPPPAQPCA